MCPIPIHTVGKIACKAYRWRRGGTPFLGVVTKAAFDIVPGGVAIPAEAPRIHRRGVEHPDNPIRGLVEAADVVPFRPQCDVIVRGRSFGYGERRREARVRVVQAGATVLDKRLLVEGDDPLELNWAVTHQSEDNPFGAPRPAVTHPHRPGEPACFAPTFATGKARRQLAGASGPPRERAGWLELAEGFDWRFFQSAPPDQWVPHLGRNTAFTVEGMHPERRSIEAVLPPLTGFVFVAHVDTWHPVPVVADLLMIWPEAMRVAVTWRAGLRLERDAQVEGLRVLAGLAEEPGQVDLVPVAAVCDLPPPSHAGLDLRGTLDLAPDDHLAAAARAPNPFPVAAGAVTLVGGVTAGPATPFPAGRPRSPEARHPIPGAPWGAPAEPVAPPHRNVTLAVADSAPRAADRADEASPAIEPPGRLSSIPPPVPEEAKPAERVIAAEPSAPAPEEAKPAERVIAAEPSAPPPRPPSLADTPPPAPPAPKVPVRPPVPDVAAKIYGSFG